MPTITLHDVPESLHQQLQQQAQQHHRSIDCEVMELLKTLFNRPLKSNSDERLVALMHISRRCATAPEYDPRSADDIIGYDANGCPA
jgi:plasmid stability protein